MHRLALFEAWGLGIDWHRFDLGTARLGHVAASLQASGARDHFLCVAAYLNWLFEPAATAPAKAR